MADRQAEQEELAEMLEPLLEECLDMFGSWEQIDTGVFADNLATALIERLAQTSVTDVPTQGLL